MDTTVWFGSPFEHTLVIGLVSPSRTTVASPKGLSAPTTLVHARAHCIMQKSSRISLSTVGEWVCTYQVFTERNLSIPRHKLNEKAASPSASGPLPVADFKSSLPNPPFGIQIFNPDPAKGFDPRMDGSFDSSSQELLGFIEADLPP